MEKEPQRSLHVLFSGTKLCTGETCLVLDFKIGGRGIGLASRRFDEGTGLTCR